MKLKFSNKEQWVACLGAGKKKKAKYLFEECSSPFPQGRASKLHQQATAGQAMQQLPLEGDCFATAAQQL